MPQSLVIPDIAREVNLLLGAVTQEQTEHELEIIELQANTSVTPLTHDTLISDTFSDADGYLNSVNTGNTSATFSTNKYINSLGSTQTIETGSYSGTSSTINTTAIINAKCILTSVRYVTGSATGTVSISVFKNGVEVAQKTTANGNVSSLDLTIEDYTALLDVGDTCLITMTTTASFRRITGFSTTGTYANISNQMVSCSHAGADIYFRGVSDSVVEIDLPSISGEVVASALVVNGEVTSYDLTDGTNNDTDLTPNGIKNDVSTLTSNPTKIKINLANSDECKTYCLKLWKS